MRRAAFLLGSLGLAVAMAACASGHQVAQRLHPCMVGISGMPRIGGGFPPAGVLAAELPDQSLVVGASLTRGSTMRVVLRRVVPDCYVVRSFGTRGTATVTVGARRFADIDAMSTAPDGRLVFAGTDNGDEIVGRLLSSGRMDASFGHGGWARVVVHEKPVMLDPGPAPTATSIAFGPGGKILLGGNDGEAHCCAQDFVTELTADGEPANSFGDGGSVVLPSRGFRGSYTTEIAANKDGSVYSFGDFEQGSYSAPTVVRIRPDGSLDRGFDSRMARALRPESPYAFTFSPALVPRPAGAFALIGDFGKACFPGSCSQTGGGDVLALGIRPTGDVDSSYGRSSRTRVHAGDGVFANPAVLRLPSGRVLVAGLGSTSGGYLKAVLVRAFRPDGLVDHAFGNSGAATIEPKEIPRTYNFSIALARAAGGNAWLVVGFPAEIDLVPIAESSESR